MSQLTPIHIDITAMQKAYGLSDQTMNQLTEVCVNAVSAAVYATWEAEAKRNLRSTAPIYVQGLIKVDRGKLEKAIVLTGILPNMLENGATPFDIKEGFKKIALGVTEEEAQAIWAKYGLSPQNFMMVKAVDKKMQEVSANVLAGASEKVKKMQFEEISARTNPIIKKLLEDKDNVTEKDIQEADVLLGKLHGELLVNLQNALNQYAAYTAWKDRYEQTKKEAEEEDKRKTNEVLTQKDTGFECF